MNVAGGSTDITTYFVLRLSATGLEATGLAITNFDLQYTRSGAAPSAKVDATALAATDTAHTDNYAIEIDATDQPGLYRVDWPDAAFTAGVKEVILTVKCATCFTEHLRVSIDAPVNANVTQWLGTAPATPTLAGVPKVDVQRMNGGTGAVLGLEAAGLEYNADERFSCNVELMQANTISAAALSSAAGTEIADAVAAHASVTAIKTKTDQLTFTNANRVDAASTDANGAAIAPDYGAIIRGTVDTGSFSATVTEFEADDITEATADHYNGRSIVFTSGALLGQATSISDYSKVGSNGHFTVVALTEAPGNNVTFVIV